MTGLKIAPDLTLPLDLVTEATAIVATRGAGKTSASVVVIEEAHDAGVQTVVFDRTGVYWGLRSNTKGNGDGLPIYVLGGPHGDAPLEAPAGRVVADLAVDTGHSLVLDLSDFSKGNAVKFAADFLERLYDRKARARSSTLLVLDEAHFYAPQTPHGGFKGDSARLMGAMEDVVGLGRSRGLGVILTTQRTQSLNKAVLDLIETLLVMRMLSPRARDAVKDWIREKQEDDDRGVIPSLDSLPTGTAWVWSPLRSILEKVAVRRITTFDSYATPKPGQTRVEPTKRKQLDLDALGAQIAATIEKAKAEDPKELRRRIRELEHQVEQLTNAPAPEPVVEWREVAVLDADWREAFAEAAEQLFTRLSEVDARMQQYPTEPPKEGKQGQPTTRRSAPRANQASNTTGRAPAARPSTHREKPSPRTPAGDAPRQVLGEALPKAQRKVLTVLAQQGTRSTTQVAILTGYSHKSGGYRNALSSLRTAGYIEGRGDIDITPAGLDALGSYDPLPVGADLLQWWKDHHLSKAERAIVDVLVDHHGGPVEVPEIADQTGYSASSGGFRNALSRLRSLEIAAGRGELTLNEELIA